MEQTLDEFVQQFANEVSLRAAASNEFEHYEFVGAFQEDLENAGIIENLEPVYFADDRWNVVIGGWDYHDEGVLSVFMVDRTATGITTLLPKTDIDASFKRATTLLEAHARERIYRDYSVTSDYYSLMQAVYDRFQADENDAGGVFRIDIYLLSDRVRSSRTLRIEPRKVLWAEARLHVWDIDRLHRLRQSADQREPLVIDFIERFGEPVPCLTAPFWSNDYESYLAVIPGSMLAGLYGEYGPKLLEQNVRFFLQNRGAVNRGIRDTIINEPDMFFAYNNGISATASDVVLEANDRGLAIVRVTDLQIVNGGQTTASLFHTSRTNEVALDNVFVQMKLSVIHSKHSEVIVQRISEYSNTQNKVATADFSSNHPFHVAVEQLSRTVPVPQKEGEQVTSHWFYERARGQYLDAQAALSAAEKKRFRLEYPRNQLITKTDLAKFENSWEEQPRWVNLGSQKNFAQFAQQLGEKWESHSINSGEQRAREFYARMISRAIVFKAMERTISNAEWYEGGYRANLVAYAVAAIAEAYRARGVSLDYREVWRRQSLFPELAETMELSGAFVKDFVLKPQGRTSNISEWAKSQVLWDLIRKRLPDLIDRLPPGLWKYTLPGLSALHAPRERVRVQGEVR